MSAMEKGLLALISPSTLPVSEWTDEYAKVVEQFTGKCLTSVQTKYTSLLWTCDGWVARGIFDASAKLHNTPSLCVVPDDRALYGALWAEWPASGSVYTVCEDSGIIERTVGEKRAVVAVLPEVLERGETLCVWENLQSDCWILHATKLSLYVYGNGDWRSYDDWNPARNQTHLVCFVAGANAPMIARAEGDEIVVCTATDGVIRMRVACGSACVGLAGIHRYLFACDGTSKIVRIDIQTQEKTTHCVKRFAHAVHVSVIAVGTTRDQVAVACSDGGVLWLTDDLTRLLHRYTPSAYGVCEQALRAWSRYKMDSKDDDIYFAGPAATLINSNNVHALMLLVKYGVFSPWRKTNLLSQALRSGCLATTQMLIEEGARPDRRSLYNLCSVSAFDASLAAFEYVLAAFDSGELRKETAFGSEEHLRLQACLRRRPKLYVDVLSLLLDHQYKVPSSMLSNSDIEYSDTMIKRMCSLGASINFSAGPQLLSAAASACRAGKWSYFKRLVALGAKPSRNELETILAEVHNKEPTPFRWYFFLDGYDIPLGSIIFDDDAPRAFYSNVNPWVDDLAFYHVECIDRLAAHRKLWSFQTHCYLARPIRDAITATLLCAARKELLHHDVWMLVFKQLDLRSDAWTQVYFNEGTDR